MDSKIKLDTNHLLVFHESRKRRLFVGELSYDKNRDQYEFIYSKKYISSKKAIPVGPELDLFKIHHRSAKGKLFPSFADRIPLKSNPAYKDYCKSQGISPEEKNQIILLGAIGKRGPSSFVFELIYKNEFLPSDILKIRNNLQITQHDLAEAFDLKKATLQKIETGRSRDVDLVKIMQIFFEFPEVALWQLKQTGGKVHGNVLAKLVNYFVSQKIKNDERN